MFRMKMELEFGSAIKMPHSGLEEEGKVIVLFANIHKSFARIVQSEIVVERGQLCSQSCAD